MKPAVDEMFPEGAGPYVDLDEVRRPGAGEGRRRPGESVAPCSPRAGGSPPRCHSPPRGRDVAAGERDG